MKTLPDRFTVRLNGVTHAPGYPQRAHSIAHHGPVPSALIRQPHETDPNAIAVHAAGVLIGWVDRNTAQVLAPNLDAGVTYYAETDVIVNANHPTRPGIVVHCTRSTHPPRSTHQDRAWTHLADYHDQPSVLTTLLAFARIADLHRPDTTVVVRAEDIAHFARLRLSTVTAALDVLRADGLIDRHGRDYTPTSPAATSSAAA